MSQAPARRKTPRRYVRIPVVLATAALLALTACFPAIQKPSAYSSHKPSAMAAQILTQLNRERAARGLPGLSWNSSLAGMAQTWSQHMADTGSFSHRDLNGAFKLQPFSSTLSAMGENILRGPASLTSGATTAAFMKSSGHRHNILAPGFSSVGIGVVCQGGRVYVTHNFGRSMGSRTTTASNAPQDPIQATPSHGSHC